MLVPEGSWNHFTMVPPLAVPYDGDIDGLFERWPQAVVSGKGPAVLDFDSPSCVTAWLARWSLGAWDRHHGDFQKAQATNDHAEAVMLEYQRGER
jgi:hypothetical protein